MDDDRILDMEEKIHWVERKETNFLEYHNDINTFIIINETSEKIDYQNISCFDDIRKYDNIFTADLINEYISIKHHLLHVCGTIGYSADTEDADFIYDKKENKIYIISKYRLMCGDYEFDLYKDSFEISYDKYWTLEKHNSLVELKEIVLEEKHEEQEEKSVPFYRYPRTKDGISIPRIIHSVFKVFSDENAIKPKIIIPNYFNNYKQIRN
jgi:hypothetical protein